MKKSELTAFIKEEILSTLTTEGVWSKGDDTAIRDFILDVKQLKDDYYHIVGSDDVFDGLDAAIRAANELIAMNEDAQTQQDIKDTEELTKAMDKLAKAKKEAGLAEEEDAPAGDIKMQKKATKQDLIIKNYQNQQKELKKHLKDYKEAKGEEEKQAALKKMKDISQSAEYLDAKAKYEKLKKVKV